MYDVQDYDDPEEFYFDHMDEFEDVQDERIIGKRHSGENEQKSPESLVR